METLKQFLRPELIWFVVGLVLLMGEFFIPGLVVFFFAIGAFVVAAVCAVTELSLNWQLGIFLVCSLASLAVLRRWLRGIFAGHVSSQQDGSENLEDFVGQRAVVKERIDPKLGGKVEFHGTDWRAVSDQEVAEGEVVEIVGKEDLTLRVRPV